MYNNFPYVNQCWEMKAQDCVIAKPENLTEKSGVATALFKCKINLFSS